MASSGPSSIVCRLVISVSRPKTVMNQGIPAAGSIPIPSPVRIRSAARSATDCEYDRASTSCDVRKPRHLQMPRVERGLDVGTPFAETPFDHERQ